MIMDQARLAALSEFYRRHLLREVMPFWESRTRDSECGGYLTCFDRAGNLTDTDKYTWFQGRQLYMFSALHRNVEPRPHWLDLARHGRDFLVRHAYAGNGRWNYHLDRAGAVRQGTISIFTDHFVLQGLGEFALASGEDADRGLIGETYDAIERNTRDLDFKDIFHGTWSPRYRRHGVYMMGVNTASLVAPVLGPVRTRPLVDHCLEQILHVFAKDDRRLLFESVARDGSVVDEPEGRVINPGHTLESTWFCLEEGLRRHDRGIVDRAVQIADWAYERGHDRDCGGIFSFLDASGQEPLQTDWHRETRMFWHDKAWWVHAEALYGRALAAVETGSEERFAQFLELHDWCQRHFYDPEYGEWYAELWRDGRPKNDHKGTMWKAAYHLPRALMKLMLLFRRSASRQAGAQPAP
jgi:N-acylglucosamine 2-epimerase